MTGPAAKLKTVSREEAERIARSGLSPLALCLCCVGLVLVPTVALAVVLSLMS